MVPVDASTAKPGEVVAESQPSIVLTLRQLIDLERNAATANPAIAARIFGQILLVAAGAEAFSCTEITELSCRGHAAGRLSVDVVVDPAVDQWLV
jgi:hypothetical protein